MAGVEVIVSTDRCRQVVADLLRESVVAMDAEGVQLGKDGPMTLLQIGTMDGKVFLFDVQENRDIFTDGRLAEVLESSQVLKVKQRIEIQKETSTKMDKRFTILNPVYLMNHTHSRVLNIHLITDSLQNTVLFKINSKA